ncbi:MAG: biotin/lipoyl-containing protein [bacterium]|jgi:biotin carboxyl carrier protein|nr:biotin/lipoyl-containing protein [bacterium]
MNRELIFRGKKYSVHLEKRGENEFFFELDGIRHLVQVTTIDRHRIVFSVDGTCFTTDVSEDGHNTGYVSCEGIDFTVENSGARDPDYAHGTAEENQDQGGIICSPIPGKVIKVNVREGDEITKGACLIIIESMKMENNLVAPRDAVVDSVNVSVGDLVESSSPLILLKEKQGLEII